MFLLTFCTLQAVADSTISILVNRPYHGDGDTLALDVRIQNGNTDASMDFYVCLEIAGTYYFYPSFSSTDLDHRTFTLSPGELRTETVIPPVVLPSGLPNLICTIYSIGFQPGTWDIVTNVAIDRIRLQSEWQELPGPEYSNSFYFMPGVEGMDSTDSQSRFDEVARDLREHFETRGIYARLGVTLLDGLLDGAPASNAAEAARKAESAGMTIGYHTGVTSHHTFGWMEDLRQSDRRLNQWESDGTIFNTTHDDLATVTVSRYATSVVALRNSMVAAHAAGFLDALARFPRTVVCINGPIEVELRRSSNEDPHYADYSPFSVMEFRDWLIHRGLYDDQTGEFAGEGFPMHLIGGYNFSEDPAPDTSTSNGPSFNEVFGTGFTTWDLLYWDPSEFPDPLPLSADPLPAPGQTGHIAGGFDPPRDSGGSLTGGNSLYQKLWDGWRSDLIYEHRTGFGFRQASVQHYVSDNARWFRENGVPMERIYSHQIPVDFIGNWYRERGSASPFWTAINPYGNSGYTAYFETTLQEDLFLVTRTLSPRWGFFEYHPDPFGTQDVAYYTASLESLYRHRCQILVPIELYQDNEGNYRLIGSGFETAMNQFFGAVWPGTSHRRFDQPYFNETWIDYLPPTVRNVSLNGTTLSWDMTIWATRPEIQWTDWGEFDHFSVYRGSSADFIPGPDNRVTTTQSASLEGMTPGYYKVLAVTRDGLTSRF